MHQETVSAFYPTKYQETVPVFYPTTSQQGNGKKGKNTHKIMEQESDSGFYLQPTMSQQDDASENNGLKIRSRVLLLIYMVTIS